MIDQNVQQMVTGEFGNVDLIKEDVDNKNKTINLTVSGKKISGKKIHAAKQNLGQYNMKGYSLNIIQVAQVQNTENQLNRQVNMILNECQQKQEAESDRRQEEQEKRNDNIQKMAPEIDSVTSVSDNDNKQIALIALKKKISKKKQQKLIKQIKAKYANINLVKFTLSEKDD
ncbi:hypothetical protein [Lactobacillus helveticus]|uniref:Uncharacterized protein n=1 Tax=Lactobacillus helveticus TaxID=1587 RepID=A0A6A7JZY7_LACHE|nr:hypothetical protein [Lactobacillus helveticus]MPW13795.1 hypothetical protein [Lactobacillus helveticus]